jgi:hypothetical protein
MRNPSLGWRCRRLPSDLEHPVRVGRGAGIAPIRRRDSHREYVIAFISINVALAVFNLIPLRRWTGSGSLA